MKNKPLYIHIRNTEVEYSEKVQGESFIIDYDADDKIVGIEILDYLHVSENKSALSLFIDEWTSK